ncbi:peptide deformylase [Candidatus Jorgensenbacteria bacterium GWA1_49_17]|uniref:Peptide deformylase n=2 Tax=Parcubacteria group TaxID=1794811 RepID=A0A0G1U362_9BACT|nr:MAG: Peptide deformylase [Parcubacteria group bacterium GW2011_GWC1_43_11]KKU88512.1 MAG: Peptide deformylase [Candidatus Wolfebacteria bacterium GW2011_GWA2_47_9b]OGG40707.1 MAG: peptide deformylase [Candidatus Jorgensenbacteria bacterium GWA1_49_17]
MTKILSISDKKENAFLRKKLPPLDFSKISRRELRELIAKMRVTMKKAIGIGLAANQIGRTERLFVAQVTSSRESGSDEKFYAVLNPKIVKSSGSKIEMEEGCLSVPRRYGVVPRFERVVLEGYNLEGKKIKLKARGLLARVFQHEVDHLDGKVFVDRTKKIYEVRKPE